MLKGRHNCSGWRSDQLLANTVHGLIILLLDAFDRHKSHRRLIAPQIASASF